LIFDSQKALTKVLLSLTFGTMNAAALTLSLFGGKSQPLTRDKRKPESQKKISGIKKRRYRKAVAKPIR
jgi:hypothetical protein